MYVNSAGLNPALFLRLLARHLMSVFVANRNTRDLRDDNETIAT